MTQIFVPYHNVNLFFFWYYTIGLFIIAPYKAIALISSRKAWLLITSFLIHFPFLFTSYFTMEEKRKKNNQSCGQKLCLSAWYRSSIFVITKVVTFNCYYDKFLYLFCRLVHCFFSLYLQYSFCSFLLLQAIAKVKTFRYCLKD